MPLAELRIARGRGDCPELLRAHSDRCFALILSYHHAHNGSVDDGSGADANMSSTAPAGTTSGERKRWGIGGTALSSPVRGMFWKGRSASGTGILGFSRFGGLGATTTARRGPAGGGGGGGGGKGGRERMGLETDSVEERDALVSEINELVRLAGLRASASVGDCSDGGRDLFDEWCRSPTVARDSGVATAGVRVGVELKLAEGSGGGGDALVAPVAAEST